jgi:hypothetical protein
MGEDWIVLIFPIIDFREIYHYKCGQIIGRFSKKAKRVTPWCIEAIPSYLLKIVFQFGLSIQITVKNQQAISFLFWIIICWTFYSYPT